MDTKIGIFICNGCDIAKSLDIDKLKEVATEDGAALCKSHDALCSVEGVQSIRDDVSAEGLNRVSVAACTPRMFPELFEFGDTVLADRANMREQVVWCHTPNDEDTQMLAEDQIRMSIARLKVAEVPEPYIEETSKEIMVVGGGITGMTAAKASADAGYKVHLIEKEDKLGGWATKFRKVFPKNPPYQSLEDSGHLDLAAEVEKDDNITVHLSTTIAETKGQPGKFEVSLENGNGGGQLNIGSIIQATGWKPYEPAKLDYLGYGSSPDVITNIEMEEMASAGDIKRPSDGKPIESIAFIQCAGSRDQDHLPYCSAVCCRVSLKQAM
ncbi:MAG: CoB--CoM heterodisulfide reductase iron-sulfur subunit A family protein, partial [FCB group bacterium]|nr:CoB--CoM heterodisulfide reductase iron-sulfur subunit A family protein [FCB group bacterium]